MKVPKNFKLISISMLLIVGLAACGKQASTTDRMTNPDEFLQHLVSTNATVLGTRDGETSPSYLITFSNGYMMSGRPGEKPVSSGQVFKGGSPNATCVGFNYRIVAASQDFLCVAVRDSGEYDSVAVKSVAVKKGDLYITHQVEAGSFGRGFTEIYRAQVQ